MVAWLTPSFDDISATDTVSTPDNMSKIWRSRSEALDERTWFGMTKTADKGIERDRSDGFSFVS